MDKRIEIIKKNIENKKIIRTISKETNDDRIRKENLERRCIEIKERVLLLIEEAGGIQSFIEDFSGMKEQGEIYKWEFDEEKIIERLDYADLPIEEQMKKLRESIKNNIVENAEKENIEIDEKEVDEFIKEKIIQEYSYNRSHEQKHLKNPLKKERNIDKNVDIELLNLINKVVKEIVIEEKIIKGYSEERIIEEVKKALKQEKKDDEKVEVNVKENNFVKEYKKIFNGEEVVKKEIIEINLDK